PTDSTQPASLHIHNVLAHGPYARVMIEPDQTTNVSRVLREHRAPANASGTATANNAAAPATGSAASAGSTAAMDAAGGTTIPTSTASATASDPSTSQTPASKPTGHSTRKKHRASHSNPSPTAAPASNTGMAIAIDTIKIEDGSANYADLWIQPHFG